MTAGQDGSARLWDSITGKMTRSFRHGAPVRSVAIDPSGTRVATGGGRTVSLWLPDATRLAEIRLPKPVTAVAFNADGRRFVVIGNDHVARVYDSSDGRLVASFDQGGVVTSAEFSDVARLLVTTGKNETARIWRLRDGARLHELKGHRGAVLDAAFSPGGARLATASADGTGRIWNVRTGESRGLASRAQGHRQLRCLQPRRELRRHGQRRSLRASVQGGQRNGAGVAVRPRGSSWRCLPSAQTVRPC